MTFSTSWARLAQKSSVSEEHQSEVSSETISSFNTQIAMGENISIGKSQGGSASYSTTDGKTTKKSCEAAASLELTQSASAKIPARSGYLGGRRPALMLKGDKRPHFEGDDICVTNHGVVFTWRISKVDFRAYSHELERVSAQSVIP